MPESDVPPPPLPKKKPPVLKKTEIPTGEDDVSDLLIDLTTEVHQLSNKVSKETEVREKKLALIEEGQAALDKSNDRWKKFVIFMAVVALVASWGAWRGFTAANKAQEAADKAQAAANAIEADRERASATGCNNANALRSFVEQGSRTQAENYVKQVTQGITLPPEQQARVQPFIDSQAAAMKSAFPHRDCSEEGRNAYQEHPIPFVDPDICEPSGRNDGLCKDYTPPTTTAPPKK